MLSARSRSLLTTEATENTAMRRVWFAVVATTICLLAISSIPPAFAQSFSFPVGGFTTSNVCANSNTPPPSCQILTNGSPSRPQVVSGGILRLTTANTNQHGSAWFDIKQPLATGFTTAFQFQVSKTNSCFLCTFPADGLALVIQNDPSGTGALGYTGNGQNLAYGNNDVSTASGPGSAILNSLAIELDTHQNTNYLDPDGNHIAVQSCGPNNSSTLTPNSADHNYICPNGALAKLALQSLPTGLSLTDGLIHTITVNYLPPGACSSSCNNLSVYFDSTLILQTTVDITTQLNLTSGSSAYIGFTAATGASVENNDIISWSFSQWPLSPITINQPLQPTVTNFNYTSNLNAVSDYSQSGLPPSSFQGVFMQGTVTAISDQQFSDLVNNTPFQGSTCQHQDTGNGNFACVTTTDLCTTPTNSQASGANCLTTTNPAIGVSNTYNIDISQKPLIAPGYIMGKDNALSCGASGDNTCKGLVSIFTGISGDATTTTGHTNNFNSVLIPILGSVQPHTSVTTSPALNGGWTNGNLTVNFSGSEIVPTNNLNPPPQNLTPAVTSFMYSATGANLPSPASGTLTGASGSINIPVTQEGTTVITYAATDSSNTVETVITNSGNTVSSASPTFTLNVDLTPPTLVCTPPTPVWQATDVTFTCAASDTGGSGLVGPSSFTVQTNVPAGVETNSATISAVTVKDLAGNTSLPQPPTGSFGPFWVDKASPLVNALTISPTSPVFGQSVNASYNCTDGGSGVVMCGSSPFPPGTSNTGTITTPVDSTVGTHTFTVTAQDAVGNNNNGSPASITYVVSKAAPLITWATPAPIPYGTALSSTQLNASANVPGTFTYTPAAGAVLTAGTQTLSVSFSPTDSTDYTTATATVQLIVNRAVPSITWSNPAPITYGTALSSAQLNASANVPGTFTYTPAAGTVLTAGTQTLSVSFSPTDSTDYTTATATVQLIVNRAVPSITWSNPAAITYGTALSSTQLNATASVPGSFVYSPAAGTILPAGTQTLGVTFTPTDGTDYTTATKSVSITINQASSTTTITSVSPNPAPVGSPVVVSVSVIGSTNAGAPTGTVTIKASTGEICSAAVTAGGCTLTFAATGLRTITASYSGDANFAASSTTGSVSVTVGDFSITATPLSVTISSGHQAVYTIVLTPIGGLTGNVNLSCSGGPPNTSCSVSPSVDNLQGNPITSTVTLMSSKNVTHGTYTLTFTGSYGNGALVHSTSVSLTVKGQN